MLWGNHVAVKYTNIPYSAISIPLVCGTLWIFVTSLRYFIYNRQILFKEKRIPTILYLSIVIYFLATIIKVFFIKPAEQDFLRQTQYIFGAMITVSSIMWLEDEYVLKKTNSTVLKMFYVYLFVILILFHFSGGVFLPYFFYIPLFFALPQKRKLLPLFLCVVAFVFPGQRMILLRIVITIVLFLLMKYSLLDKKKIVNFLAAILMILPFIFFILALKTNYNIFESNSKTMEIISYGEENMSADTRTLLYQESIDSSIRNRYELFGRTFGYGYDSQWQVGRNNIFRNKYASEEFAQRNAEVFILNIYTWMGLFGVILFYILFSRAVYLAINSSNNKFIRYVGILVAIEWVYCWVENSMIVVNYTQISIWMLIAMCYSSHWRNLSNSEFENRLKYIFNYRVR